MEERSRKKLWHVPPFKKAHCHPTGMDDGFGFSALRACGVNAQQKHNAFGSPGDRGAHKRALSFK